MFQLGLLRTLWGWLLNSFDVPSFFFFLRPYFYFLALPSIILMQALELAVSPRNTGCFYWRLVFRYQDLGVGCAYCYCFYGFLVKCAKSYYMCTNQYMVHISIIISWYIYIYVELNIQLYSLNQHCRVHSSFASVFIYNFFLWEWEPLASLSIIYLLTCWTLEYFWSRFGIVKFYPCEKNGPTGIQCWSECFVLSLLLATPSTIFQGYLVQLLSVSHFFH